VSDADKVKCGLKTMPMISPMLISVRRGEGQWRRGETSNISACTEMATLINDGSQKKERLWRL